MVKIKQGPNAWEGGRGGGRAGKGGQRWSTSLMEFNALDWRKKREEMGYSVDSSGGRGGGGGRGGVVGGRGRGGVAGGRGRGDVAGGGRGRGDVAGGGRGGGSRMNINELDCDIMKIRQEMQPLVLSHMTWKERKDLENKKVVALGGKPPKRHKIPLSVARKVMKNQKKREEKLLKENAMLEQVMSKSSKGKKKGGKKNRGNQ